MSGDRARTQRQSAARGADHVVAVLLIGGQALASMAIGSVSLLFMMISDGCHDEPDDPFICSDAGGTVFLGGILLEWALLVVGLVVSIRLVARASSRGETCWTKPFVGAAIGLLGILVLAVNVAVASA
ncbi:hypothetical protein [Aeromicrobium endophyticum]|uniref:Uncharacterized protein n=1 Tax=Aeromicrobium endophyticum TaxID=2292704 RepID=A0A371PB86_9ACTN|nr:hypothetical protein [Aeromicrobium endophyticum]REK73189.1 hypothetical protein DX116_06365 [Aeromicrobium endophyticum]